MNPSHFCSNLKLARKENVHNFNNVKQDSRSVQLLLGIHGREAEEQRPGHLQPPGGLLRPDDLEHHLPAVRADSQEGASQDLLVLVPRHGAARPGEERERATGPGERADVDGGPII